jgi:hypothetical protein
VSDPDFTDDDAIALLDALKRYYEAGQAHGWGLPSPRELRVHELAGDLIDSLPRGLITDDYSMLEPDAVTAGSHYRTRGH